MAKDIMLMLNVICCGLNFAPFRGQHCTAVETHVMSTASAALRLTAAVSRNGKFTDMLPLMPGNFTFIREVAAANPRTARAKSECSVWLPSAAYPAVPIDASIIAPMNIFVRRVLFMPPPFLRTHTASLFIVASIRERGIGIADRRSPDDAGRRCGTGARSPNDAEGV